MVVLTADVFQLFIKKKNNYNQYDRYNIDWKFPIWIQLKCYTRYYLLLNIVSYHHECRCYVSGTHRWGTLSLWFLWYILRTRSRQAIFHRPTMGSHPARDQSYLVEFWSRRTFHDNVTFWMIRTPFCEYYQVLKHLCELRIAFPEPYFLEIRRYFLYACLCSPPIVTPFVCPGVVSCRILLWSRYEESSVNTNPRGMRGSMF